MTVSVDDTLTAYFEATKSMGARVVFSRSSVFEEDAFFVAAVEREEVRSVDDALDLRTVGNFKDYEKYLGEPSALHLLAVIDGVAFIYQYDAPWHAEFQELFDKHGEEIDSRIEAIERAADDAERRAEARLKRKIKALRDDPRVREMVRRRITLAALVDYIREHHFAETDVIDVASLKREVSTLRATLLSSD